jgi:outer membrane protein OmpA-like peptidoglycan-associated protein
MKKPNRKSATLVASAVGLMLLASCSTAPIVPPGASDARSKLTQLQSDPQLATRAPVAIKDAELAVGAAEKPQQDMELGKHLVFMADRKVDIAASVAQSQMLVDQRDMLNEEREAARLDSRTREIASARSDAASARLDANAAQMQTDVLRKQAKAAQLRAEMMKQEIAELNAKPTDRGLVVTLGDLLFATNKSELQGGSARNLTRLAAFLDKYKDRSVIIEGFTDNTGTDVYNIGLSQRRADSVKAFLVSEGIVSSRLISSGKGEASPVAGNETASGRQQNRRVEVIIANEKSASL